MFCIVVYYGHFVGFIGLCFVRVLSLGCSGLSVGASDLLQRLVSEMTYNDPAHSLTVFSLIPV